MKTTTGIYTTALAALLLFASCSNKHPAPKQPTKPRSTKRPNGTSGKPKR